MTLTRKSPLQHKAALKSGEVKIRARKCSVKGCKEPATMCRGMNAWCSVEHGAILGEAALLKRKAAKEREERAKAKKDRADTKLALEKHKPLSYFEKKAERACNEYIRARDPDICISCEVTYSSAWQAGHYIAVGANSTLRYDEDNIHKQCIQCNMFKGSNAIPYREGLLRKIGLERVERLEGWHPPVKMTREAALEIEAYYKAKLKALRANQQGAE